MSENPVREVLSLYDKYERSSIYKKLAEMDSDTDDIHMEVAKMSAKTVSRVMNGDCPISDFSDEALDFILAVSASFAVNNVGGMTAMSAILVSAYAMGARDALAESKFNDIWGCIDERDNAKSSDSQRES